MPPVKSDNADLVKAGRERAPTITIDSFAVKVDLIKLDVEGMELRALEGGRHTIARDKPIIFLEFIKSDQGAIVGFFRQQGFKAMSAAMNFWPFHLNAGSPSRGSKRCFKRP
ncbi:MAG: FkbM family methyltransferase [Pseudomonadota bacterium]|nr:FkbM family methyltransferase [Pseudomonadota bacterium]